ncbi:MAG: hypothetical protein EA398_09590 [Deltaproteobacteria bacterium]|nr:MAG: hypothetical protein EA398_09590 [Deltaproteobacteria bacterium]
MMRFHYLLLASLVAFGMAACGDDDAPATGTDDPSGPGSVPSTDTPPTSGPGGTQTTPPANPCNPNPCDAGERCEVIDDETFECISTAPPTGDCPTAAELNCPAGTTYVGCACIDNVDPDDYEFSGVYSYINSIIIPPDTDEEACCYDLNGDGEIDNALGRLLPVVGTLADGLDVNEVLLEALEDDSFGLLVEYRGLGADLTAEGEMFGMSVFLASDASGEADAFDSWADRNSGNGVFSISRAGFGDAGSQVQFNNATIDGSSLIAGPSTFVLALDLGELTDGLFDELILEIDGAILTADVEAHANGIATTNETINEVEYGGGKLGGAVDINQIVGLVDDLARECTCAGLDPDRPVLISEIVDGQLEIFCADDQPVDGAGCTSDDGLVCENLSLVCTVADVLSSFADVDTSGDGVDNGVSVGLRLGMTGAELAADPLED